ncbi:MAG: DNA polymerase III subunit chi [Gammaproteobacteria bacterium]|nr:DNA polymerase III subunit chi [Gammaproteobacteria bacterium]
MATPRVDFYVLSSSGANGRLHFACRLAERAYGELDEIYAHTESPAMAGQLDELLWTFRQGSFIPHETLSGQEPRSAVCIGTPAQPRESGQLLINLTGEVPAFAEQFARIAEIVDTDESSRAASRQRFKRYREMGIEPVTHTI